MRRHIPGCPWCRESVYVLHNKCFEIEGGDDFVLKDWEDLIPVEGAVIKWVGERKAHAHCVMFNYGEK